jgi:hypothetical protein
MPSGPGVPSSDDLHEEISRLEERIEVLAEAIERCRKISLASRLVLGAGAAWVLLMLLQAIPFAPLNIIVAIAALLGGTVLLGSNASTRKHTEAALEATEARRRDLIGSIDLRLVGGSSLLH